MPMGEKKNTTLLTAKPHFHVKKKKKSVVISPVFTLSVLLVAKQHIEHCKLITMHNWQTIYKKNCPNVYFLYFFLFIVDKKNIK
jgi:hypothetical protein